MNSKGFGAKFDLNAFNNGKQNLGYTQSKLSSLPRTLTALRSYQWSSIYQRTPLVTCRVRKIVVGLFP